MGTDFNHIIVTNMEIDANYLEPNHACMSCVALNVQRAPRRNVPSEKQSSNLVNMMRFKIQHY